MPATTTIEQRVVNQRDGYKVTWTQGATKHVQRDPDHTWGLVRSVKPGRQHVAVFNIEVEGDNSYVADGIVVHNCQPFSAAGDGEGEFDDRDGFPWLLRLLAKRLPDVLIVENVKGLTFRKHSAYLCAVLEGIRALGYDVDWRVLNTADHGVPQTRERCIIVARRDGGPITWPMPTHCELGGMFTERWVSMADALGWHASDALGYTRGAGMNERHGERQPVPATSPAHTMTGNLKDFRHLTLHYRQTRPTFDGGTEPVTADLTDKPAPTPGQQSQHQWIIDDDGEERRLSIMDAALLQGFPADWAWTGNKTQQAKCIGNAVPPRLAEVVAAANRPIALEVAA